MGPEKQQTSDAIIKRQNEALHTLRRQLTDLEKEMAGQREERRFQAAVSAMRGLIAGVTELNVSGIIANRPQEIAELAVLYADTLLDQLSAPHAEEGK